MIRCHAQFGRGRQTHERQRRGQSLEQEAVVGAAATHVQASAGKAPATQGIGHAACRQFGKRGLHVGGRQVTVAIRELPVQPVNGKTLAQGKVPRTAALAFTANDAFDIGMDSYSPVSLAYFDRAPFKFNGKIEKVNIKYLN